MESIVQPNYAVLAEFESPDQLVLAARRSYESGYRDVEAYSPIPVEGLAESLGFHRTRMPLVVLLGALVGGLAGYALQYWVSVIHYPLNIGGRPLHSWPAFVPVTFETTILIAALSAVFGMLARNGLPRPHHPLFDVPAFARASQDRFFLCILTRDPKYDYRSAHDFLKSLNPTDIYDVPQ